MEGRTAVIPQTWDGNMLQVATDVAQNDPEGDGVIFVEDEPEGIPQAGAAVSEVDQQAYERPILPMQQPVMRKGQASLIVQIKAWVSMPTVDTMEGNEWPGSTAETVAPVQGTATDAPSGEGLPNIQEKELQHPNLQVTSNEQPRIEAKQPLKAMLVEMAMEEDSRATQPLEAAAEMLAAVLPVEGVWHYADTPSRRSTSFRINQHSGTYTKGTGYSSRGRHRW
jgi:hypothetical protein